MILNENNIITKIISNLQSKLENLKSLTLKYPGYKILYELAFSEYRELLGKQVWLKDSDFEFEKALVDEFFDLEDKISSIINKINQINK